MAYPTTGQGNQLWFKPIEPNAMPQGIHDTSTTQQMPLGFRCKAKDFGSLGYGVAEFIYLKGVASTAPGDIVTFDEVAGTTTRSVAATRGPTAVAMSANVANQFGWYQVMGQAVVNTTAAGTGAANPMLQVTATPGQATVSGTANVKIDGATCKTAQDTPTVGFTQVSLHFPCANGNT